jgi:hypothetical protein
MKKGIVLNMKKETIDESFGVENLKKLKAVHSCSEINIKYRCNKN